MTHKQYILFKRLTRSIILTSGIFASTLVYSEDSIDKNQWITNYSNHAKGVMCQTLENNPETNKILQSRNMTHDQCVIMIEQNLKKCIDQYTAEFPSQFDQTAGEYWGEQIGKCVGRHFDAND